MSSHSVVGRGRRVVLVAGVALAVLLVLGLGASSARAAEVLDQSQPNFNTSTDISPAAGQSWSFAQTFTPGTSGTLDQVDLGLGVDACGAGCPSGVLNVAIYATDASGFPTGAALGTGTVSPSALGIGAACCVTVAITPVSVSAGTTYAIVLTDTNCCGAGFIMAELAGGGYPGGELLFNFGSGWGQTGWDIAFRTYINVPPGPTSKDQCKKGGWKSFGDMFHNQGQCVTLFDTDT